MGVGRLPSAEELEALARSPVTRNVLLKILRDFKQEDLFPKQYLNLQAIAESDLVRWLMHPHELKTPPDNIELVKEIPLVMEGKELLFCVFKYRTLGDHWRAEDGWMAGIAGPYAKDGRIDPFPRAVFSQFEKIELRSPEEHLQEILRVISR